MESAGARLGWLFRRNWVTAQLGGSVVSRPALSLEDRCRGLVLNLCVRRAQPGGRCWWLEVWPKGWGGERRV